MKETDDHKATPETAPDSKPQSVQKPMRKLFGRVELLVGLVAFGLYVSDSQGYFNADQESNHTEL